MLCTFTNGEKYSYVSLLAYCYWFIFYRVLHADKDLYNNLASIMDRKMELLQQFSPVITVGNLDLVGI